MTYNTSSKKELVTNLKSSATLKENTSSGTGQKNHDQKAIDKMAWFDHLTGGHTHTDFFAIRPTDYSKANEGEDFEDVW